MPPFAGSDRAFSVRLANWHDDQPALLSVRTTVFVEEQGVPLDIERDAWDSQAQHCLHTLALDGEGKAIGAARLLFEPPLPRIGRMAVLAAWRGRGVGRAMLECLCDAARQRGADTVRLFSQVQANGFYLSAGFAPVGEVFIEANIAHQEMRRST